MSKKIIKHLVIFVSLVFIFAPVFIFAQQAAAQTGPDMGINYVAEGNLGLAQNTDPRTAAVSLVKLLMTFLGIIAVVIILLGGFKWMTAAGNEDKVSEAKKLIGAGIIGLVIILAAFLIVNFVVTNVSSVLNS
jgi:hypothetical protein